MGEKGNKMTQRQLNKRRARNKNNVKDNDTKIPQNTGYCLN